MPANTGWPPDTHQRTPIRQTALPAAEQAVPSLAGRAVLLAVDDSPASNAAIHVAHSLAAAHGVVVHALHVLDDRSAPVPPPLDVVIGIADATVGPVVHAQREAELQDRLVGVLGDDPDWSRMVHIGNPPAEIARHAKEVNAALIIMGLRRHAKVDRALHDETTLNTIRHAPCPVLGVAAGTTQAPSRVLVAVDFSPVSVDAARAARALLLPNGQMHFAYVPPALRYRHGDGEGVIHELGVRAGFEQLERELADDTVSLDHVVLHHELQQRVADLLLEYATAVQADLISAGSVGRTLIDRWLIGSVSTDLVRDGRHTLLITPLEEGGRPSSR